MPIPVIFLYNPCSSKIGSENIKIKHILSLSLILVMIIRYIKVTL